MKLGAFGRIVADLGDALVNRRERLGAREFVKGLRADIRNAFLTSSDPVTGMKWPGRAPGNPSTQNLLVHTGLMMNSALVAADSAVPSGFGITVELAGPSYSKFHQHGTSRMPQRRFFGISPETRRNVRRNCIEDIVKLTLGGKPA